jgi:hypothetical protein
MSFYIPNIVANTALEYRINTTSPNPSSSTSTSDTRAFDNTLRSGHNGSDSPCFSTVAKVDGWSDVDVHEEMVRGARYRGGEETGMSWRRAGGEILV